MAKKRRCLYACGRCTVTSPGFHRWQHNAHLKYGFMAAQSCSPGRLCSCLGWINLHSSRLAFAFIYSRWLSSRTKCPFLPTLDMKTRPVNNIYTEELLHKGSCRKERHSLARMQIRAGKKREKAKEQAVFLDRNIRSQKLPPPPRLRTEGF